MRFLQWLRGRFGKRDDDGLDDDLPKLPRDFGKRYYVGLGDDQPTAANPEGPTRRPAPSWSRNGRVIGVVCAILIVVHLSVRTLYGTIKDGLDVIALVLIVVGLSPWLATIIESFKLGREGAELKFREVEEKIEQQGNDIRQLKFLISHFLPEWEYNHLVNLASSKPFIVNLDETPGAFADELRHLRALDFIRHKDGSSSISDFIQKGDRVKNVSEYFKVTDSGHELLDYRRDDKPRPPTRVGSQAAGAAPTERIS
jgi:hypothetical protein